MGASPSAPSAGTKPTVSSRRWNPSGGRVPEDRVHRVPPRDELVLVHDRTRTIPEVLERSLRYAPLKAQSMIDAGQEFSARAMVAALARHVYKQFVRGRALRDGVPGMIRAGLLVGFHFYVWAAFWQLSGATRTPNDDRYLGRAAAAFDAIRTLGRMAGFPVRLLRRPRSRWRVRTGSGRNSI
jgi:hypothetical protein